MATRDGIKLDETGSGGSGGSGGSSGGMVWEVITVDTIAEKGKGYLIDASSNPVTLTMPLTPSDGGSPIGMRAIDLTNPIRVNGNGETIEGDSILDIDTLSGISLVFSSEWKITTEVKTSCSITNGMSLSLMATAINLLLAPMMQETTCTPLSTPSLMQTVPLSGIIAEI